MPIQFPNPLLELHQQAEAEFQPYVESQIVSTFGQPQAEYSAIRKSCGLIDLPHRGILELAGKDRLAFLNNLLTNQTWDKQSKSGLKAGQGVYAFLLNLKGRIVADMNVLELGDRTLLEMDARIVEMVAATFDKYLFGEQVKIKNQVGQLYQIALHGPGAAEIVGGELSLPLESATRKLWDVEMVVWRDDPADVPGYYLILPIEQVKKVWENLLQRFGESIEPGKRNLRPVGWAAFNATRIEAGRAIFGIDFDESVLPAETGQLQRAVSFTKGCYMGQEIVARMAARDQVARKLVGLRLANDALPMAGSAIYDSQSNQIGAITSSSLSPVLSNAAIATGYVKRPNFEPGTVVKVPAEGTMHEARVVDLPFIS